MNHIHDSKRKIRRRTFNILILQMKDLGDVGIACNYDYKAYIITVAKFRDKDEIKVKVMPN